MCWLSLKWHYSFHEFIFLCPKIYPISTIVMVAFHITFHKSASQAKKWRLFSFWWNVLELGSDIDSLSESGLHIGEQAFLNSTISFAQSASLKSLNNVRISA